MKKLVLSVFAATILIPSAALAQEPVRVGGQVRAPELTKKVAPIYPEIAQAANISGVVVLELTIGPSGDVTDAKVVRSIALLDQAAIDAVKQWRYKVDPVTVNGVAVPLMMTVTVNFTLPNRDTAPSDFNQSSSQTMTSGVSTMPPSDPVYVNGREAIRIGGAVKAPELLKRVAPVYPVGATDARVAGIVILEATIDELGRVVNTKILRSIDMLDQAAIDAVSQWEYAPTMINGVAVPVVMTVTVNFTLQ